MSSKNLRKGRRKKGSTWEAGEGKIIRLKLSRQKKREGGSKATPLLGTRCETQNSQQLKITVLLRKQTQRPRGREGIRSHPTHSLYANSAHTLRHRTECLHPLCPALISHPVLSPQEHLGWGQNWKEKWGRAAVPAPGSAPFCVQAWMVEKGFLPIQRSRHRGLSVRPPTSSAPGLSGGRPD